MPSKLCAVDLCSGPGGVTVGYKAAGIAVIAAIDIDPKARATYKINHPEVQVFDYDLMTLAPEVLLKRLELRPGALDILTACVPCQTFSSLGRRNKRRNDPRNRLVGRIASFVRVFEPRAVVMENVPPLATDLRFKHLIGKLRRLGYGVWFDIVDAADFGVPQRRRRLVLIALRGKTDEHVPKLGPYHPLLGDFRDKKTVKDALDLLDGHTEEDPLARPRTNLPSLVARRIAAIPKNGGSRSSLPPELSLLCHKKMKRSEAANVYGRMSLHEVAPTLTTRCTTPACGRFIHPTENRAITLREAACLQTFPADYCFEGGSISIQAQIGNAVPPKLAQAIAILVRDALS